MRSVKIGARQERREEGRRSMVNETKQAQIAGGLGRGAGIGGSGTAFLSALSKKTA